jgi:large subunit ribosomal protein L13
MKFTKIATPEQIDQKWILIDAEGKTFGRMITEVATILRGKLLVVCFLKLSLVLR